MKMIFGIALWGKGFYAMVETEHTVLYQVVATIYEQKS